MAAKRKGAIKTARRRFKDGLRRLFRSRDHTPSATESDTWSNIDLNYTDWDGLARFNDILKTSSGAFGPLVAAISQFSEFVKRFEGQAIAREEYMDLGTDLNDLFHALAGHFEKTDPVSITLDSCANLARSIGAETKSLETDGDSEPQEDGGATKNMDNILRCYRRVRTLLALFAMNENAKMWKVDDDEAPTTRLEILLHTPNAHYRAVGSKDVRRTGCTPNTRIDVLQDLRDWIHYGKFQQVYWLSGIAGTGKTTVAYSLCEWLENSGKPAASFFCSRDLPDCRDVRRILPSLTYQLARLSRPFRCAVSSALEHDPELCNRPVDEQFKRLIAEPFQNVGHTFGADVVIVLDALDECEDQRGVNQILDACFDDAAGLPVRFLITGRRIPGISERMIVSQPGPRRAELRLHEVDGTVARQDVRTYLGAELEYLGLSDYDLERLAWRSGGWFLHAASVVNLSKDNVPGGAKQLQQLLDITSYTETVPNPDVDALYTAILEQGVDQAALEDSRRADGMLVLRTALCMQEPVTINIIAGLLRLDFDPFVHSVLRPLLPVFHVSNPRELGMTLHDSFASYLSDPDRSGKFYCDFLRAQASLAQSCFTVISGATPAFNVCNLESSHLLDREVTGIDERVNESISQAMWYASRHWATHLKLAGLSDDLLASLHNFSSRRLLLWMEVMNLKRDISGAVELLHGVHTWLQEVECPVTTRDLVFDAWKFVAEFSLSVVSKSTPHIYVSALRFWPPDRSVSVHYMPMLRNVVKAIGARPRSGGDDSTDLHGPATRILRSPRRFNVMTGVAGNDPFPLPTGTEQSTDQSVGGHTSTVVSVAYSPDGAYIASGSYDNTVRIWDAQTGQPVGRPLNGHTSTVWSVAYSPDSAYIASGSGDKTVRIWDAQTGQPVRRPLNGHTDGVRSVAYSPDGAYIASGSSDNTVRIWDAQTGQPVSQPLKGHTRGVASVAYSPDGAYIASGSRDHTVQIWDAQTCQPVGQPLNGHTSVVWSVAYSPDGAYIASGSHDETVRIWDAQTGQPVGQQLNGHTDGAVSVAFSPNSAYIASGSADKTVRIWDAQTGQLVGQPLNGHTKVVVSVAYSPDGAYIASGSWDSTIRIWDSRAGHGVQLPEALSLPIRSLISSAISRYITRAPMKAVSAVTSSHILTPEELLRRWLLDDQGWVVNTRQERLIWVPEDLREFLLLPPTMLVLPLGGRLTLDFRGAKIGSEWQDCFDSSRLCA